MAAFQNFRSAVGGFNREDVVHYIEFLNSKHNAAVNQLRADLMSVVGKALENYNAMRCTEGAALDKDLRSRGQTILELVAKENGNFDVNEEGEYSFSKNPTCL